MKWQNIKDFGKIIKEIIVEFEVYIFAVGAILFVDWQKIGDGWWAIVQRNFWQIVLLFLLFIFTDLALRVFKNRG